MSSESERFAQTLSTRMGTLARAVSVATAEVTMEVDSAHLIEVATMLRDDSDFKFEQLADLCAVDYLHYGSAEWETSDQASSSGFSRGVDRNVVQEENVDGRFHVVYHLLSLRYNRRLRLRTHALGNPPMIPSVVPIWNCADWFEREAFDLYGVLFDGHPDLRRILTDYGFIGHPFRKDFPLTGEVEMRYDPEKRRVVYEPVTIVPRTLVPKVIRGDSRHVADDASPGENGQDA